MGGAANMSKELIESLEAEIYRPIEIERGEKVNDRSHFRNGLRKAIEIVRQHTGWQPMEIAPTGVEVWVAYPHSDGSRTVFMATRDHLGWDSQFHWRLHGEPVAWMHTNRPLPPPPGQGESD
jgi:hypothetical protein